MDQEEQIGFFVSVVKNKTKSDLNQWNSAGFLNVLWVFSYFQTGPAVFDFSFHLTGQEIDIWV